MAMQKLAKLTEDRNQGMYPAALLLVVRL